MKINKIHLIILICVVVAVAWWFIGDVALGGLLALFGLGGGKKDEATARTYNTQADEHVEMAEEDINTAAEHAEIADKVNDDIAGVLNQPVDHKKPIDEVVEDAKKDWS